MSSFVKLIRGRNLMKIRIRFPAWSSTFRPSLPSFQVPDCPLTVPAAINQEGVVVGVCANSQGSPDSIQGFIRDPKGRFTVLPELRPTGVNVHGAITGVSGVPNFGAFLRSPRARLRCLASPTRRSPSTLEVRSLGFSRGFRRKPSYANRMEASLSSCRCRRSSPTRQQPA